jgi:thiol:disulfide interchange protein
MIKMMNLKRYLLVIGIVSITLNSFSQIEFREIKSEDDWVKAVEAARSSDKLLFLDIYATWCGPCKYLENNVYTDENLGEYYNVSFINLKMDRRSNYIFWPFWHQTQTHHPFSD